MGKIDDIQAYKEWTEYHRSLKGTKPPTTSRRWNEKRSWKSWRRTSSSGSCSFFSEFAKYPFTKFHKKAIKRITTNMEWYEVLSWSRELAKSTIVFMCMMYLVLTGKKKERATHLKQSRERRPAFGTL